MKGKLKYLLFTLAAAFIIVGATGAKDAAASSVITISEEVKYDEETITVSNAGGQVYYQVLKDTTKISAKNWIAAAKDGDNYIIDFSAVSNTATMYVVYTTNVESTALLAGETISVALEPKVKSFKVAFNYGEEDPGSLYDVLSTVSISTPDKKVLTYGKPLKSEEVTQSTIESKYVVLGWKKGANGNWKGVSDFDATFWNMMKASNTTMYLRIEALDFDTNDTADTIRYSKEIKVKIPKTAKAPTVKIDYTKNTLAIKNGMEMSTSIGGDWKKVLPYDKNSDNASIFVVSGSAINTKTKASTVTVDQVKEQLELNGTEQTIYVRTSATDKKFASFAGVVKFTLPAAAPTLEANAATKGREYTAKTASGAAAVLKIKPKEIIATDTTDYEYILCLFADKSAVLESTKNKWVTFTEADLDLSKKVGKDCVYYKGSDNTAEKVKYEEIDCILIRKKAVKATKDEPGVFASGIQELRFTLN